MGDLPCPKCGTAPSAVKDVRRTAFCGHPSLRRHRLCPCGHRWTTYEVDGERLQKIRNSGDELISANSRLMHIAKLARPPGTQEPR